MIAFSMDAKSAVTTAQHTTIEPTPSDTQVYFHDRNVRFYAKPPQKKMKKETATDSDHTPSPQLSRYTPTPIMTMPDARPQSSKAKNMQMNADLRLNRMKRAIQNSKTKAGGVRKGSASHAVNSIRPKT